MDLSTNGVIISDTIRFVTQKQEQTNTLQKLDERIAVQQQQVEEEETTGGVAVVIEESMKSQSWNLGML